MTKKKNSFIHFHRSKKAIQTLSLCPHAGICINIGLGYIFPLQNILLSKLLILIRSRYLQKKEDFNKNKLIEISTQCTHTSIVVGVTF